MASTIHAGGEDLPVVGDTLLGFDEAHGSTHGDDASLWSLHASRLNSPMDARKIGRHVFGVSRARSFRSSMAARFGAGSYSYMAFTAFGWLTEIRFQNHLNLDLAIDQLKDFLNKPLIGLPIGKPDAKTLHDKHSEAKKTAPTARPSPRGLGGEQMREFMICC